MDDMSRFQDLFLSTAGDHIRVLKQLLEQLKSSEKEHEYIVQLHLHAHSLKGEAFAMGYKISGSYITVIEKYFKSFIDNNNFPNENKVNILISATKDIENAFEEISLNHAEPADLAEKQVLLQKQLEANT